MIPSANRVLCPAHCRLEWNIWTTPESGDCDWHYTLVFYFLRSITCFHSSSLWVQSIYRLRVCWMCSWKLNAPSPQQYCLFCPHDYIVSSLCFLNCMLLFEFFLFNHIRFKTHEKALRSVYRNWPLMSFGIFVLQCLLRVLRVLGKLVQSPLGWSR